MAESSKRNQRKSKLSGSLKPLTFTIRIDGEEWNQIKPVKRFEKDRIVERLVDPWTRIVKIKIWNEYQLPCAFSIKKQTIYKRDGYPYLRFFGKCKDKKCGKKICGECIEPDSDGITIHIKCFDTYGIPHTSTLQLRSKMRSKAEKDLLAYKPGQYKQHQADMLLNDSGGHCPLLPNTPVISKTRQTSRDKAIGIDQYPGDTITSVMAIMEKENCIRELSTIPFYVYFWTDNQLTLWKEAKTQNAFISIDASGSFVKKVDLFEDNKSTDIFLYNIVTNVGKKIYSICQALSSTHDTNAIFSWLLFWLRSGAPIPEITIVDCSGALLNSVALAFNQCYFTDYLTQCLDLLNGKSSFVPPCLIKRDRAHLIKAVSQWKCFQGDAWIKKDFYIRCIAYSLEVDNLKLLEEVMISIFVIAESEYSDINSECNKRKSWLIEKIATFDYENIYKVEDENAEDTVRKNYSYINDEIENVKSMEKISTYVENIYNSSVLKCSIGKDFEEANNYYLPSVSKNLINLYSQFPAWTNVMNRFYTSANKTLTSARSECFYRILRRDWNMTCAISLNRFLLAFLKEIVGSTKLGRSGIKLLNSCDDQSKTKSIKTSQKEHVISSNNVESNDDNVIELVKSAANLSINKVSQKVDESKKDLKINCNGHDDRTNDANVYCTEKTRFYYATQLIKIYQQSIQGDYTVAIYNCSSISKQIFSIRNLKECVILWGSDLKSLQVDTYVLGSIIDSFMLLNCINNWKKCSFISTDQTNYILGYSYKIEKPDSWSMYNIDFLFSGLVFLPYCFKSHWCLLVLNVEEKTMMHLNPLGDDPIESDRAIKAFTKYLKECKSAEKNNLCQIKWRSIFPCNRSLQNDVYNCGPFIMFYMNSLASGKTLEDPNFDPNKYRSSIAVDLICKSEPIIEICLYCMKTNSSVTNENIKICKICKRWADIMCIIRRNNNYNVEDPLLFNNVCILCDIKTS